MRGRLALPLLASLLPAGCGEGAGIRPTARYATAAAVVDGVVYVVGGVARPEAGGAVLATTEAYDPATRRWTARAPMRTPRAFAAAVEVRGKVLVFGGLGTDGKPLATVEAYEPLDDAWTPCRSLPGPRSRLAAASMGPASGYGVLVGGGMDGEGADSESLWRTDGDHLQAGPPLPGGRHGHAMAWDGNRLVVAGGYDAGGARARVDLLDGPADSLAWVRGPSLGTPRGFFGSATLGNRLYVVGGRCPSIPPTEVLDMSVPEGGWERAAPLPKDLCRFSLVAWNGRLLAFGGETDRGASVNTDVLEYDPEADAWSAR